MSRMKTASAVLGLCLIGYLSEPAGAAEICVVCEAPAAQYRCLPQAAAEHQVFLDNRRLVQLACVQNIAKAYGHGSCKANTAHEQVCKAPVVKVDLTQMARQYVNRLPKPLRPGDEAKLRKPIKEPKPRDGEPKTVVELAKRTVETSQQQLEKAGDAVKNAGSAVTDTAKKTWRCLTTFFQNC